MKKITIVFTLLVLSMISAVSASAQLRFGLKAGVAINSLHFNENAFSADNQAGFTGGAMLEFTAPVVGIGMDLSLMYVRRNAEFMQRNEIYRENRDYIDIPLNLKWKMNLPLVNKIVRPMLFTGPSFSFLTTRRSAEEAWRNRKFDTAWNFGFGAELFSHVQVAASYGLGLTKTLKSIGVTGTSNIEGHNRYWTVTAAYLF